jgi:hypothetical protein
VSVSYVNDGGGVCSVHCKMLLLSNHELLAFFSRFLLSRTFLSLSRCSTSKRGS